MLKSLKCFSSQMSDSCIRVGGIMNLLLYLFGDKASFKKMQLDRKLTGGDPESQTSLD